MTGLCSQMAFEWKQMNALIFLKLIYNSPAIKLGASATNVTPKTAQPLSINTITLAFQKLHPGSLQPFHIPANLSSSFQ